MDVHHKNAPVQAPERFHCFLIHKKMQADVRGTVRLLYKMRHLLLHSTDRLWYSGTAFSAAWEGQPSP